LARAAAGADEVGEQECRANEVMASLLMAARVDEVAARVVLQRLLPGLIARARRWSGRPVGGPDALDELLAAAWTVIRTFPVERRPRHLVANLLRDAEYHAFVRPHRRLLVHEFVPTHTLERPAPESTMDAAEELAELIDGSRALTDRDRRLLALLASGASMTEVATTLDVCVRTVTNHRDAVVHRLRQVASDMAVACVGAGRRVGRRWVAGSAALCVEPGEVVEQWGDRAFEHVVHLAVGTRGLAPRVG
jgi:DNA-directed RNA polymerase specialized sigma24 family protein